MKRLALAAIFALALAAGILSCGGDKTVGKKVIILGIDGMDPILLQKFLDRGVMPNTQKLIASGDYKKLTSSIPPQSPVAWSNFITGSNPGKHGIFDFIHRDPQNYSPFLSTTMTEEPAEEDSFVIGKRVVWLKGGKVSLLRRGRAFWQDLAAAGIRGRVFKIPSNFPPVEGGWSSSGMGTPDMLGTYGTFTFYTNINKEHPEEIYGGTIVPVFPNNGVIETEILGPPNTFQLDEQHPYLPERPGPDGKRIKPRNYAAANIPLTIFLDEQNPAVKIEVQDREVLLNQYEWSGWVPIIFKMWPGVVDVKGMVRFYLKSAKPDNFQLYMSPVNMDPTEPAVPVSNPAEYFAGLAEQDGFFYTQGMPENTKARQADLDVLNDAELFDQMMLVHDEDLRNFRRHLDEFNDGFLFFYFGSLDMGTHMFWRLHDWQHPAFDPNSCVQLGDPVELFYRKMDHVVGTAMARMDANTTLIVMSDHGFAPWYRSFQVNSWLLANGYIRLAPGIKQDEVDMFADAAGNPALDWSRTSAYNLGINSIYVNLEGREKNGAVPEAERRALVDEIAKKLEEYVDPVTGERPVLHAYKAYEVYQGEAAGTAPDIIVGYRRNWRGGDDSALGKMPSKMTELNLSSWSGDHCMDTQEVPGIIITNRKMTRNDPALIDLGPTVLSLFGLPVPAEMDGRPVF